MDRELIAVCRTSLRRSRFVFLALGLAGGLAGLCLPFGGCNRAYYRVQADREAYALIQQKQNAEQWPLARFQIEIDPRSRMYDPFSADCPPMPPDDPAAHEFMHQVDGKKGYPGWHANGDTSAVENPNWLSYLPVNEQGVVVLNADTAVALSLLHSTTYQQELEDLYLSALDVSFERFRFDHQFFGGYSATYTADGRARTGSGESSSLLNLSTFPGTRGLRTQRFYTTGASLVAGFANSLVWQFAGPDDYRTNSLLDFSLVQPLLRSAGRDRIMERLTIAERTLLANVRQMERFQRGFYLRVVTGLDAGPGPSRRGGFFGGSGLDGFSGVGGGGFGGVGSSSFGGGATGGAGAQDAGGFIGLLQDRLTIRNREANIASLRSSLAQLQAFFEAGRIDYFQVEQARQALFNAESQLLNSRAAYFGTLDSYKLELGLPPQLPTEVRDPMLDEFDLIDTETVPLQNELTRIQDQVGTLLVGLIPSVRRPGVPPDSPAGTPRPAPDVKSGAPTEVAQPIDPVERLSRLRELLQKAEYLREALETTLMARAEQDVERLRDAIPRRRAQWRSLQMELARDEELGASEFSRSQLVSDDDLDQLPDELLANLHQLRKRLQDERYRLAQIDKSLMELQTRSQHTPEPANVGTQAVLQDLPNELNVLTSQFLELALTQARARTEAVTLVPVHMDWTQALEIARQYRLDWMNTRAALVDAWRLIEFNADDLESQLDIVFSGDLGTVGDNPFRFRDTTGRLRAGLQFDAPITRLSERNTYRQALIEYQQARRSYYRYRDRLTAGLRTTLRSARVNHVNFELRRAAVQVAITQVELSRLRLQEPPRPNVEFEFGATTARDLVSALSDLLNVQNDFLSVWVSHEVLRRSLDFNLGTMQLTSDGLWLDPGPIGEAAPLETVAPGLPGGESSGVEARSRFGPGSVPPAPPQLPLPPPEPNDAARLPGEPPQLTARVRVGGELVRLPLPPDRFIRQVQFQQTEVLDSGSR